LTFQNWGRTVKNTPTVTYYPETVAEIIEIVRDAVAKNKGIRVAGFRKLLFLSYPALSQLTVSRTLMGARFREE
jgi:hypothetical protein